MDPTPRADKRTVPDAELGAQLGKKPRCELMDLKRVAEIVLALSTLAKIRGGEKPTEAEIGLMDEARAKLVELCEDLPPKEIVARDAIAAVIEDLGLNAKLKEQQGLGFRGPKLTVAEKFALTKRKMDESKKYAAQTATYPSQPLKTSFNAAAESHGMPHTVRMSTDSPNAPIATGGYAASPLVHVSTVTPTSAQYQLPVGSGCVSGSQPGRDSSSPALPRGDRVQLRTNGGSNGSSYTYQVQANSSANQPPVNAPTWSTQTHSGPEQKMLNLTSMRVEGTAGTSKPPMNSLAARDQNPRPFTSQPASGHVPGGHQPSQKIRFVQASSLPNNSHNEIAKIIQKLLQPQVPDYPTWIPPSRDYMSKALTCQTCQLSINEVDNVLICDACEKGYHITCAQSPNQRGIPRGEWHCTRCLSLSNGKPLPPKYGRVMRSNIQLKVPSSTVPTSTVPSSAVAPSTVASSTVAPSTAVVQMSSGNKVGAIDSKVDEQKINAHVSSVFPNPAHAVGLGTDSIKSETDPKVSFASEMQGNNLPSSSVDTDVKPVTGSFMSSETSSRQTDIPESSALDRKPSSDLSDRNADPKISAASETEGNKFSSSSNNMDEKTLSGTTLSGERTSQQIDMAESPKSDKESSEPPADLCNKDSDPNVSSATEIQGNNFPSSCQSTEEKPLSGSFISGERSSGGIDNSDSSRLSESSVVPPVDLSNKDADSNISNKREMQGNNLLTSSKSMDEKPLTESFPFVESLTQQTDNSELSIFDKIPDDSEIESPADTPNDDFDNSVNSQPVSNSEVVDQAGLPNSGEDASCSIRDDQDNAQENTYDGLRPVEWIGDPIQVVSEKHFYSSCRIDGVTYELQEHALLQSGHGKLKPSKLQSMWEDMTTGSKWVTVNSCYFPTDVPENVGHPSIPESNEVYESNHESTVMASLILGPCEVLPLAKFSDEIKRRSQLGDDTNNELRPVFLCKWNYDESKGLLQPVSQ